ncbi:hypothetical protein [Glycomyces sp. NPDC048151]|uniref:hypothetical protein n=1 Tax=Glycomyces sp. NPDC048151 TaxID=3364002 RepID=UPI003724694E
MSAPTSTPELDNLAESITALAGARKRIPVDQLIREVALNILILSRIASNRLEDRLRREEIESATDHLITQLRHASWELPIPGPIESPSPPDPSPPPIDPPSNL